MVHTYRTVLPAYLSHARREKPRSREIDLSILQRRSRVNLVVANLRHALIHAIVRLLGQEVVTLLLLALLFLLLPQPVVLRVGVGRAGAAASNQNETK